MRPGYAYCTTYVRLPIILHVRRDRYGLTERRRHAKHTNHRQITLADNGRL